MNKWLLLLVVIGLAVAGWMNREMISGLLGHKPAVEAPADESGNAPATPNPATESIALARKTYPALAVQGSVFNMRFVGYYNEVKGSNPGFLAQANWPMLLAERTAKELTGAPTPVPANHLTGSALDPQKPKGPGMIGPTPTPVFLPPGLQGSALDARPSPKIH
jgi:hypothetical protein